MQADKATTDAMAKKIAKPDVPKSVIQKRLPVASPEKESASNINKEHRGSKLAPRRPLETLVGTVRTKVSNTSHPQHCLCFSITIFSETA